ncbi:unnamed protein product [Urochloa humidicola]
MSGEPDAGGRKASSGTSRAAGEGGAGAGLHGGGRLCWLRRLSSPDLFHRARQICTGLLDSSWRRAADADDTSRQRGRCRAAGGGAAGGGGGRTLLPVRRREREAVGRGRAGPAPRPPVADRYVRLIWRTGTLPLRPRT